MAGKKRADVIHWQLEVNNDADWEELCKLTGLVVVDVYQEWCGPCCVMAPILKDLKMRLSDDSLHCAIAKADYITQLVKFRGRSEPTWLFMAAGEPLLVMRGANAPLIRQTIITELEKEKQVLEGVGERVTIEWDSIEFPRANEETEEEDGEGDEGHLKNVLPENWINLDAILLKGAFVRIIDLVRQQFSDANVEIVHESLINEGDEASGGVAAALMIVWLDINEEDETVVEWLDSILSSALQEAIKNMKDEMEKKDEEEYNRMINEDEEGEEVPVPTHPPIEFQLLFNQQEKEDFINQLLAEPADESNEEGPVFINMDDEDKGEETQVEQDGEEHPEEDQPEEQDEEQDQDQENEQEQEPEPELESLVEMENNPLFHVEDCSDDRVDEEADKPSDEPDKEEREE